MVSKAGTTSRHSLTLEVSFTITSYAGQESVNKINYTVIAEGFSIYSSHDMSPAYDMSPASSLPCLHQGSRDNASKAKYDLISTHQNSSDRGFRLAIFVVFQRSICKQHVRLAGHRCPDLSGLSSRESVQHNHQCFSSFRGDKKGSRPVQGGFSQIS